MKIIKVLIVEDSVFFRQLLAKGIEQDAGFKVVATASDPYEARDAILKFEPDVMTLDVEMPKMNGIEFLKQLMPQYPIPTVVISAMSAEVFDALKHGAVDFVSKPSGLTADQLGMWVKGELLTKIKIASTAKVGMHKNVDPALKTTETNCVYKTKLIAMGASTGGTEALLSVVRNYKRDIPGVVIVQHMPPGFTEMYAQRLNQICSVQVKEAADGDLICPGKILIAPGDKQMRVVKAGDGFKVEVKPGERVSGHCPSVDVLFESVAANVGKDTIGIILTGMGADGSKGLLKMKQAGAETIGQNEETSVVYGMPKVAYEIGAVKYQLPLGNIAEKVYGILGANKISISK